VLELTLNPAWATCAISAIAAAGVIIRPFSWPEAVWAVLGALALLALGLIAPATALAGVLKGTDVYLFLIGMMLLAEVARKEGLFDWLAAVATRRAKGSPARLFLLVYIVGTVVTTFLSNDATAVVLTPAVAAAIKTARVKDPLPYLFICAFIANAASFVLPISNPANLVMYGSHMPPLLQWLPRFAIPSALSVLATFFVLRWTQRAVLRSETVAEDVQSPPLTTNGSVAALGIVLTALTLLTASAFDFQLGLPTAICGLATALIVLIRNRRPPWELAKEISWSVLPLVAGLFVLVEALNETGLTARIGDFLHAVANETPQAASWGIGLAIAFVCNLMNNLPAGLVAASAVQSAHTPDIITSAALVGVDLGPNLSVTGSLATILWLAALRREGLTVGAGRFLKLGFLVMPPALLLALAGLMFL
jgi:arsenical pump membrane protein